MNAEIVFVNIEIDQECSNENCHNDIENLQSQIVELERKIMQAKDAYHEALTKNLKKDIVIEKLEDQSKNLRFSTFHENLSVETIDELRSIPNSENKDSAFISKAMKDLYREDLSKLKRKTYSGRKKEAMTPEKVKILQELFKERIESDPNKVERQNKFGKCIKNAIENINKS